MNRMIAALVMSLVLVLLTEPRWIRHLNAKRYGQTIEEHMAAEHQAKKGTPTMGGVMVALSVAVTSLICHPRNWFGGWDFMLALPAISLGCMAVGYADDSAKVHKKQSEGLKPWQKIVGQTVIAVAFSVYCYLHPLVGSTVLVPFLNVEWNLGIAYIPLMSLAIIFMVNSANLQDGLDGLMSSVTSVGCFGWGMMALIFLTAAGAMTTERFVIDSYYAVAIFAMAVAGAAMAFLRFNHYPAKVFYGDTGSMFLGGAVVGMAMLMRQPLMLLVIGFTMVASSVSVIMQRTYFKLTHGKRIFLSSPIHHHFEKKGYTEDQIDTMYAVVTAVLSMIAVLSLNGIRMHF